MSKLYAYPSDVTDEEWAFVLPYLLLSKEDSGLRWHPLRAVFDACRYLLRAGCGWRLLPGYFTVDIRLAGEAEPPRIPRSQTHTSQATLMQLRSRTSGRRVHVSGLVNRRLVLQLITLRKRELGDTHMDSNGSEFLHHPMLDSPSVTAPLLFLTPARADQTEAAACTDPATLQALRQTVAQRYHDDRTRRGVLAFIAERERELRVVAP